MLFGLLKNKKEKRETTPLLLQRVIFNKGHKYSSKGYTDAYVSRIFDQGFVIRRLDGAETLVRSVYEKDYLAVELLTDKGTPIFIDRELREIIDERVEKELYEKIK